MRIILLFLFLAFASASAYAELYYVLVDTFPTEESDKNDVGVTQQGYVFIFPFSQQFEPTDAEKTRYKISVMELDRSEVAAMQKPAVDADDKMIALREKKMSIGSVSDDKKQFITKEDLYENLEFNKAIDEAWGVSVGDVVSDLR